MKISEFITRFKEDKELKNWLRKQSKDYLYSMYMEETNYDGVGYREITRKQIKDIFLEKYLIKELENKNIFNII